MDKKFTLKNVLSDVLFYMNHTDGRDVADYTTDVVVKLDSTGHFYYMEEVPIYQNQTGLVLVVFIPLILYFFSLSMTK